MMFRSLALYVVLAARRPSTSLVSVRPNEAAMLNVSHHKGLPHWPDACPRQCLASNRQQAGISQTLTGIMGTIVSIQLLFIRTHTASTENSSNRTSTASSRGSPASRETSTDECSTSTSSQAPAGSPTNSSQMSKGSSSSVGAVQLARETARSATPPDVAQAVKLLRKMDAATSSRDHATVKQLFDPAVAGQVMSRLRAVVSCQPVDPVVAASPVPSEPVIMQLCCVQL